MTSVYQGNPTTFGKNVTFSERVQFKGPTIFSDTIFPDTTHHGTIYGTHLDISGESTFHDTVHIPHALEANDVTIAGTLVVDSGLSSNTNMEIPEITLFNPSSSVSPNKGLFLDYESMKIWNAANDAKLNIASFSQSQDTTYHGSLTVHPTATGQAFSVKNASAVFDSIYSTDMVSFNIPAHMMKIHSAEIDDSTFTTNLSSGFEFKDSKIVLNNTTKDTEINSGSVKFQSPLVTFDGLSSNTVVVEFGSASEVRFNANCVTKVGNREIDLGGTVLEEMESLDFDQDGRITLTNGGLFRMQKASSNGSNNTVEIVANETEPKISLSFGGSSTSIDNEHMITKYIVARPTTIDGFNFDSYNPGKTDGGIIFNYKAAELDSLNYAAIRVNNTNEASSSSGGSSFIFQTYDQTDDSQHNSLILSEDGTVSTKYAFIAQPELQSLTRTKITYPVIGDTTTPTIETSVVNPDGTQTLDMHPSFIRMTNTEGSTVSYEANYNMWKLEDTSTSTSNTQTSSTIVLRNGDFTSSVNRDNQITPNIIALSCNDNGVYTRSTYNHNRITLTHSDAVIGNVDTIDSTTTGIVFTQTVDEQGTELKAVRVVDETDTQNNDQTYERLINMNATGLTLRAENEDGSGCAIIITPDIINIDGQMDLTSLNPAFDTLQVPKQPTDANPIIFGATNQFVHTLHTGHDVSSNGVILRGIRDQVFTPSTSSTNDQGVQTPTFADFRSNIQHRTCTTTFPLTIQASTHSTTNIDIHHNLLTHFRKIINNQTTITDEDIMRYNSSDSSIPRDNRVVQVKTAVEIYDTSHDLVNGFTNVPKRNIIDIMSLEYTIFITQSSPIPEFMFTQQISCRGAFRLFISGDSKTSFAIRDMKKLYAGQTFQVKTVSDIHITTISTDYSNATS